MKFVKITGRYKLKYIYGKIKTHKPKVPLRPIISQITTPPYHIYNQRYKTMSTKTIPTKCSINSTHEFIEILKKTNDSILASLNAENLFTNVNIKETISIKKKILITDHHSYPQN